MLALALGAACAPRVDSWKTEQSAPAAGEGRMPRSWEDRIGVYTFADALNELGEPAAIDSSGAGVVAVWERVPRGRACLAACAAGLGGASDGFERSRLGDRGVYIEGDRREPVAVKKDALMLVFNEDRVLVAWSRR